MPQVEVDGVRINYAVQGEGEPLLLIPYTSADHACYAFQLPAYTEHFTASRSTYPARVRAVSGAGPYSTGGYADPVAAFLGAIGAERAHVAGVPLGAAVGIHLPARHSSWWSLTICHTAGLHEDPETFNRATLDFLLRQRS